MQFFILYFLKYFFKAKSIFIEANIYIYIYNYLKIKKIYIYILEFLDDYIYIKK